MGSTYFKSTKKIKHTTGKEENLPMFMQFVPGIVVEVVTNRNSLRNKGNTNINSNLDINTIIAKPHIYEGQEPRKGSLSEDYRYKPLLRGWADVPSKGDPVLLCTIGKVKYYLGPLNTQNNPNWNSDSVVSIEKPLGNYYNIKNKKDILRRNDKDGRRYLGQSKNFKKVYFKRLNKLNNELLDFNHKIDNHRGNNTSADIHGDMTFEGRHGNSIRIGSRSTNPYIYISNGRAPANETESLGDGSLISVTNRGTLDSHFGYYKDVVPDPTGKGMGMGIGVKKGFTFGSTLTGNKRSLETLLNKKYFDEYMNNQILIQSGRLVFNSIEDDVCVSSKNSIFLSSGVHTVLAASENILIDADSVYIGNPIYQQTSAEVDEEGIPQREMQQMVLGNQLIEILQELMEALKKSSYVVDGVGQYLVDSDTFIKNPGNPVDWQKSFANNIDTIQMKLNKILSNYHYIEPNDRLDVTDDLI